MCGLRGAYADHETAIATLRQYGMCATGGCAGEGVAESPAHAAAPRFGRKDINRSTRAFMFRANRAGKCHILCISLLQYLENAVFVDEDERALVLVQDAIQLRRVEMQVFHRLSVAVVVDAFTQFAQRGQLLRLEAERFCGL